MFYVSMENGNFDVTHDVCYLLIMYKVMYNCINSIYIYMYICMFCESRFHLHKMYMPSIIDCSFVEQAYIRTLH